MTWQEELRKLDEDFSSGSITADEYRARRDQVLSSAVAPGQEQPQQGSSSADATQVVPPASPPYGVPQQPPNAEATQVVPPASPPHGTPQQQPQPWQPSDERTQSVPQWQAEQGPPYSSPGQPPQPMPGGYAQQGMNSPAAGFPQPQPNWNAPDADVNPPWGGSEFPPIAPPDPAWVTQGPEDSDDEKSKGGKIALIATAVLVVVGLGIGGFVLVNAQDETGSQNQGQPAPTGQQAPTTATSTTPPFHNPDDDLKVAALPGDLQPTDHVREFVHAESADFLTSDEVSVYKKADADEVRFISSAMPDGVHAFIFTAGTESEKQAATARKKLSQLQLQFGMKKLDEPPKNVLAAEVDAADDRPATIRAHYTHESTVVRIQLYGDDLDDVRSAFDQVISLQLEALEATK